MNLALAAIVTAAALSMMIAAFLMVYDTTLPYPGLGKRAERVVMVLWLWPVTVGGIGAVGFGLGWLWGWAV